MISEEITRMLQDELQTFLLQKAAQRQLRALPEDFVFFMMLNIGLGSWFNIIMDITVYSEVKEDFEE